MKTNNTQRHICDVIHPEFTQFSITHDDMLRLYDREKSELMKCSKEELIEKLIGKREFVGMTFF